MLKVKCQVALTAPTFFWDKVLGNRGGIVLSSVGREGLRVLLGFRPSRAMP